MNPAISTSLNRWLQFKKKLGGGTGKNTNIYLRQMRERSNKTGPDMCPDLFFIYFLM